MVKLLPKVVKVNLKMQVCCFAVVNALPSFLVVRGLLKEYQ
jgi:hypothetical protein